MRGARHGKAAACGLVPGRGGGEAEGRVYAAHAARERCGPDTKGSEERDEGAGNGLRMIERVRDGRVRGALKNNESFIDSSKYY